MPLKTWAPYERLLAGDLNAAMRYASGEGSVVGAYSETPGAGVAITNNQNAQVNLGAPAAGGDPLGFYLAPNRLRIPAGMGGLYVITAQVGAMAASGVSSTAGAYATVRMSGLTASGEQVGTFHRLGDPNETAVTCTVLRPLDPADELYWHLFARGGDVVAGRVIAWAIARLGLLPGAIGA